MQLTVSVRATKEALGLGETSVYKLISSGKLASVRVGGRRLVLVESINALVKG